MPQRTTVVPGQPAYNTRADIVRLPAFERFTCAEEFYSTAFHELAQSTGYGSRLARKEVVAVTFLGDPDYSREELVADMTAAQKAADFILDTRFKD